MISITTTQSSSRSTHSTGVLHICIVVTVFFLLNLTTQFADSAYAPRIPTAADAENSFGDDGDGIETSIPQPNVTPVTNKIDPANINNDDWSDDSEAIDSIPDSETTTNSFPGQDVGATAGGGARADGQVTANGGLLKDVDGVDAGDKDAEKGNIDIKLHNRNVIRAKPLVPGTLSSAKDDLVHEDADEMAQKNPDLGLDSNQPLTPIQLNKITNDLVNREEMLRLRLARERAKVISKERATELKRMEKLEREREENEQNRVRKDRQQRQKFLDKLAEQRRQKLEDEADEEQQDRLDAIRHREESVMDRGTQLATEIITEEEEERHRREHDMALHGQDLLHQSKSEKRILNREKQSSHRLDELASNLMNNQHEARLNRDQLVADREKDRVHEKLQNKIEHIKAKLKNNNLFKSVQGMMGDAGWSTPPEQDLDALDLDGAPSDESADGSSDAVDQSGSRRAKKKAQKKKKRADKKAKKRAKKQAKRERKRAKKERKRAAKRGKK